LRSFACHESYLRHPPVGRIYVSSYYPTESLYYPTESLNENPEYGMVMVGIVMATLPPIAFFPPGGGQFVAVIED